MKPPKPFKLNKDHGWSKCFACSLWRKNNRFFHEDTHWVLCESCFEDYWFNTDELLPDYKGY